MPFKKDLAQFSTLARTGAASLRNVVNEPELTSWLEGIADERLGPTGPAQGGAEPTKESKARDWLAKVARKHQLREGLSTEVGPGEASAEFSWGTLPWVRKAMTEQRPLSQLVLPHDEREKIASVIDWMRSDEGPPVSGDWTRVSFEQAVKAEHDWIEAKAKAFAKTQQDQEAGQGTTPFLDLSSLGASWEGWRWVRVESALALDREGALMKHCVGSYAEDVVESRKNIYSLRDPQDKPKLTVEARGPKLAQLKGFANGACPDELREAVGAFAMSFEKVADPDGMGFVKLSKDVVKAGFASLPGVGVFQRESGLSMEQRVRWALQLSELSELSKDKWTDVECEALVCSLAKMGMAQELSELLPFLNPESKHSLALSEAASDGHKEIVKMLLPLSDPLARDSRALLGAARGGHREIVEMLLSLSDPLAWDSQALRGAAEHGHKEIVKMLLPVSYPLARDSMALRDAACLGRKEIVEMLLPLSDPLARDSEALRCAASAGHKEIVQMLLPLSDAKAGDSEALRWAAGNGHKEIVEMLLPLSDPLAMDSYALKSAAGRGHREIVQMLAPCYWGDEGTFHRILKEEKMESRGFHFSIPEAAGAVEFLSDSIVGKIVGRRQTSLPREIAGELPGRPHGV